MLIGSQIGPFLIEKELGSGAMGTVYKAKFDKEPGKVIPVALKVVSLGLLGNEGAMARFDREASILKQLKHPHIVRLLAVGKYRQTPFIAMEFVDGESLDRVLVRRTKLAWEEVVQYGKQLCEALQHAHDKGIIHRDLKPSNLMVTKEGGILKLTDFGIAKDTDVTALTGANSTIGTAAYMSPEQCRGDKTLGAKSDLYSLGVCFYELLTGKKPFTAESTIEMFTKQVSETPVRPRKLEPDIPIWLDNLIMFCLEKNKEARPMDAATIGRLLTEIEEKVQSQQSVGVEMANARKVDRPVNSGPLDEEDKEAARRLRGDKKKRKKKRKPLSARPWFRALPLVLLLGGIVAFAMYQLVGPTSTPPLATLADKVDLAGDRGEAAAEFLREHNTKTDPAVDKVRAIFRDEKTKDAENGIVKRYSTKMKNNADNYDAAVYPLAISALEAEKSGDLKQANTLWASVRDKSPQEETAKLPSEDEVLRVRLRWVAEKRLADLKAAPEALQKVLKQIDDDKILELERSYEAGSIDALVHRAVRLESFGDKPKARRAWQIVVTEAEQRTDLRSWQLIGAEKVAKLTEDRSKGDELNIRIELLKKTMEKLSADALVVEQTPVPAVGKRTIRNTCREIMALYADETEAPLPTFVQAAKLLLTSLPK